MNKIPASLEEMIFDVMDQCKSVLFPGQRYDIFLDCSKNEIFTLLFIYRRKGVKMSDVAEYMQIPLNTVTGVVGRLEKKGLLLRLRSQEDKRVVLVSLTPEGEVFLKQELDRIGSYFSNVMRELEDDEKELLFKMVNKIFQILNTTQEKIHHKESGKIRKILIE